MRYLPRTRRCWAMRGAGAGRGGAMIAECHRESSVAAEHVEEDAAQDSSDTVAGDRKPEAGSDAGLRVAPNDDLRMVIAPAE